MGYTDFPPRATCQNRLGFGDYWVLLVGVDPRPRRPARRRRLTEIAIIIRTVAVKLWGYFARLAPPTAS